MLVPMEPELRLEFVAVATAVSDRLVPNKNKGWGGHKIITGYRGFLILVLTLIPSIVHVQYRQTNILEVLILHFSFTGTGFFQIRITTLPKLRA